MLRLKRGVKVTRMSSQILLFLHVAEQVYSQHGAKECVVTSVCDGVHKPGSKHGQGDGADLRTHNLRAGGINPVLVVRDLRDCLGPDYDVILEAAGTPNEHIHGEYDPK